jgi:hypothetical protein
MAQTSAEIAARVTAVNEAFPPLHVARYGAVGDGHADDTAAIQQAVRVLALTENGELYLPAGFTCAVSQVHFRKMADFRVRCDGRLVSNCPPPAAAFTDMRSSCGTYTPLILSDCTRFKLHGDGSIDGGCVDTLCVIRCSEFDISVDLKGRGLNSLMHGVWIQYCHRFRVHDLLLEGVTAQNMQGAALTMAANPSRTATAANVRTLPVGLAEHQFNVVFSDSQHRTVSFGAGTSDVSMNWRSDPRGALTDATTAFHVEVYYAWLNNLALISCYDFQVDHVVSRKAGMNGIYVLSVTGPGLFDGCHDFDLSDNTCEYCSASGIQITWNGGTPPNRYKCNGNTLRYNQADGIDASNSSGSTVPVYAQFNNNNHSYNGWINCDPSNPGGADGSGLGTFQRIANFEAIGGIVVESNNAGIYVDGATNFHIAKVQITKQRPGTSQVGVAVISSSAGSIEDVDCVTSAAIPTLLLQPGTDITIRGGSYSGGSISIAKGVWTGSRLQAVKITTPATIDWAFDVIDCNIAVTGPGVPALRAVSASLHCTRCSISASGSCISIESQHHCVIEDTSATNGGSAPTIVVKDAIGTFLRGGSYTNTQAGVAVSIGGTSVNTLLLGVAVNCPGGVAIQEGSGCTGTSKSSVYVIAGTTAFNGSKHSALFN